MSVHERTAAYADKFGWAPLHVDRGRSRTFYRWDGTTRVEIHVLYDEAGRIEAWSVWRNRRVHIDQGTGLRDRLDDFLTNPAAVRIVSDPPASMLAEPQTPASTR